MSAGLNPSAGRADMKITLRPYAHDHSRWHVDIRIMDPRNATREIRRRLVAPAKLSRDQARAWGERQVPRILRKVLGAEREVVVPTPRKEPSNEKVEKKTTTLTLAEFYIHRFEPEHVQLQKPATQYGYKSVFRCHIGPSLGGLQLMSIDDDRVMRFRAQLHGRMKASSANTVLGKLAAMLRYAKRVRLLSSVPEVPPLRTSRKRPKRVFTDAQLESLVAVAAERGGAVYVLCLLAVDMGMRVSEICALEWADVDLEVGAITVQHNMSRGQLGTPKGVIGTLAMTERLEQAFVEYRATAPSGPLVLYRRTQATGRRLARHSPSSISYALNKLQDAAGLRRTGPHMLRHTVLTRLAQLGASIYEVQAVARHSRLETTQLYLHSQQVTLARNAAQLLDIANKRGAGKRVAKSATTERKQP